MNNYPLYLHFIFGLVSTAGFCILFHVPKKMILFASISGALGWVTFKFLLIMGNGNVVSCFLGAFVVALVAEIFSRAGREATTLFIIPGILPLVPGAGMYNTMLFILEKNVDKAASTGIETLLMAGSIAFALLIAASITRLVNAVAANICALVKGEKA